MAEQKGGSQGAAAVPAGEFSIEVDTGSNDAVLFPPTQDRLRGTFSAHNLVMGDTSSVGLFQMPNIPGMIVRVNCRTRTASITDPLAQPANADLLNEISKKHKVIFQGHGVTSVPDREREGLTDDELASWVYWLMRLVQGKKARQTTGSSDIPRTERDVKKMFPNATIKKDYFNSMSAHASREAEREREGEDEPAMAGGKKV
jgi:hypothetical protein